MTFSLILRGFGGFWVSRLFSELVLPAVSYTSKSENDPGRICLSPGLSRGGGMLLRGVLGSTLGPSGYAVLIDGQDHFDPSSLPEPLLK